MEQCAAQLMQAATLMSERRAALLVSDGDRAAVVGVLTPKDALFKAVAAGVAADTCLVSQVMTPAPDLLPGSATVLQALHQLSTGGYRTVPVVDDDGAPLGVLDVLALVRVALADEPADAAATPTLPPTAGAPPRTAVEKVAALDTPPLVIAGGVLLALAAVVAMARLRR